MSGLIQVFTTTGTREDAQRIAQSLVDQRLAACVQIMGPIESTYRWKGLIEKSFEWFCFIKSSEDIFSELEAAIRKIHPYEVPEIIAVPISAGSGDYMGWLKGELKTK